MESYEKALEPFTKALGIDWEVQVEECDVSPGTRSRHISDYLTSFHQRVLWNMNGIAPPPPNSEGERLWKTQNKVVPLPTEPCLQRLV